MSSYERSSLPALLASAPPRDRPIFYAKDKIPSYEHAITANRLAGTLRPIVNRYFGTIDDGDSEFMNRCYVYQRDYKMAIAGMRSLIQDSLSPHLEAYGVQQLKDTSTGGTLGTRLVSGVKNARKGEVLVLFGGKGAGKSTFVKRLLHHNPPPWLKEHSRVAIIDLLKIPEDQAVVRDAVWSTLVTALDTEDLLSGERDRVIEALFLDRFKVAARQELAGLSSASEAYNTRLNGLFADWKNDKAYCAKSLAAYWKKRKRGIIVVLDNTDQYSGILQDFCFTSAQEVAHHLECVVLISMREERFHNSKIHGVLDAFQNSGFHISSPKPAEVFRKRLSYTIALLQKTNRRKQITDAPDAVVDDCVAYLKIILREFSSEDSPLNTFLTACARGDTRLALDLFRSFLLSGYTNVEEMLAAGGWTFQIHQVIKPVMVPDRYFYEEKLSDIPNIYQLRYPRHASHFTGLRILRELARNMDSSASAYVSMAELKSHFASHFNMLDDFIRNADVLLQSGFVEANNRLDAYSDSVDSIKITSYGLYMVRDLAYYFTYLDLVCTDCGVFKEATSNFLLEAARDEYSLFTKDARTDRVKLRLERVDSFITYLQEEEKRERDVYRLDMKDTDMFSNASRVAFDVERQRVLASAERQAATRSGRRRRSLQ